MSRFFFLFIFIWPLGPIKAQQTQYMLRFIERENFNNAKKTCLQDAAIMLTRSHSRFRELLECTWLQNVHDLEHAPLHTGVWVDQVNPTICVMATRALHKAILGKVRDFNCNMQVRAMCVLQGGPDSLYNTTCVLNGSLSTSHIFPEGSPPLGPESEPGKGGHGNNQDEPFGSESPSGTMDPNKKSKEVTVTTTTTSSKNSEVTSTKKPGSASKSQYFSSLLVLVVMTCILIPETF